MPRPRVYKSNAERQAAYRRRLKARDRKTQSVHPVVSRVMAADKAARA